MIRAVVVGIDYNCLGSSVAKASDTQTVGRELKLRPDL